MESASSHRYEILATLGRGGFGTVYRARFLGEAGFSKQVALKILNDRMNGIEDVASRLRDEARMLGLLEHRAIVRVDRLVQIGGRWAVVMEYVRGVDLAGLLETGPVPPKAALEITAEVASALAEAWEGAGPDGKPLGLVHRDIKPENILLTPAGDVKVLDFGIARAEFSQREAFTSDLRFGSPAYMAPERFDQSEERPDEASTDVYSLGTVLYEMVLGETYGRTSPIESRHQRFHEERLNKLRRARVPEPVFELIAHMLAYDRTDRPTSREVMKRALALVSEQEGQTLRLWAEEVVPPLVREGKAIQGTKEISRFLDEDGTAAFEGPGDSLVLTVEPPVQVVRERRSPLVWVLVAVAVVTAGVGGGLLASALVTPAVPGPTEPLPVPATAEVEPAPAPAAPDVVEVPAPEQVPVAAPVAPVAAPAAAPMRPTSPEALAAPPREDQPHGMVHIAGDARRVVLVGVRARYAVPGRVPPGRFTVAVDFGNGALKALSAIEVPEGASVNLRCDGLLETCASY